MTFRRTATAATTLAIFALTACSNDVDAPDPQKILNQTVAKLPTPDVSDPLGLGKSDKTISAATTTTYDAKASVTTRNSTLQVDAESHVSLVHEHVKGDGSVPEKESDLYVDQASNPIVVYRMDGAWTKTTVNSKQLVKAARPVSELNPERYIEDLENLTLTEVGDTYVLTGTPSVESTEVVPSDQAGRLDASASSVSVTVNKKTHEIGSINARIVTVSSDSSSSEHTRSKAPVRMERVTALTFDSSPVTLTLPPEASSATEMPVETSTGSSDQPRPSTSGGDGAGATGG